MKKIFGVLAFFISSGLQGQSLHPDFNLSAVQLASLVSSLPRETQELVASSPSEFLGLISEILSQDSRYVILVDKTHALSAEDEPEDMVSLDDYPVKVSRRGMTLRNAIMPAVLVLTEKARQAGAEPIISSTYRSYSYQEGLFNRYAARDGVEQANRYSARAGQSQHQLGTAFDLGDITNAFATTAAGRWMAENGGSFGFSLSYPRGYESETGYQWESWHWRYIGVAACKMQKTYFEDLQFKLLTYLHRALPEFRRAWKGRGP